VDLTTASREARLSLTCEFALTIAGQSVPVPHSVERVLAYLALRDRPVSRTKVAGVLWLDSSQGRATSNLRTTLWRLHRSAACVVVSAEDRVALAPQVVVDVRELFLLTHRLIETPDERALTSVHELIDAADLLPDWEDEWVVADRERYRLLRLEALERAAEVLIRRGQLERALETAHAAVASDPLRESARRLLLRIRLAQGNVAGALNEYGHYRALLKDEVGLEPSPSIDALIQPLARTSSLKG